MEEKTKVDEVLTSAPLNDKDKEMWREALTKMSPEDQENVFSLVKENEKFWSFFNENLKSKIEAIKSNDKTWFSWLVD